MFKKVLRRVAIGLAVIIVVLAGVQLYLLRGTPGKAITPTNSSVKYSATPTLLIPGWGGNTWTYTKLIDYYQDQNIATNAMVVRVAPTGAVQVSGSLKGKQNPLIQVIYDWNYSTTYQPQVRELTQVLQVLATKYHVQKTKRDRPFLRGNRAFACLHRVQNPATRNRLAKGGFFRGPG